jgi:hypothetical protein
VLGPVVTRSAEVYESGVESFDPIVVLLEYGTGKFGPRHRPYVIRPHRPGVALRFYSRRAHPGQRAQRPLATGVALTKAELASVLHVDLEAWHGRSAAQAQV